jgi:hypothetical protein
VIPQLADGPEVLRRKSLIGLERVIARARGEGLRAEGVISTSFGCPFATEDLASIPHEMGITTRIDLPALLEASRAVRGVLRRPLGSHTLIAGPVKSEPSA